MLTATVREALDRLVGAVTQEAGIARTDVVEMTVVGNPIMHHLFLGLDPVRTRRGALRAGPSTARAKRGPPSSAYPSRRAP